ncbi:site-specific integrase [Bacillus thuringiensis]|uniref:Site-specific integrase n=5 Tax=Bacillus thuringiensis TaxID=1428 RepID=A0AB35PN78_BACTU|nr:MULTISPECIES: site-specific integrase [Bacillus]EAO54576.1 DNA integration/recombination/inversion protein [Bacillus thuringiensis serovar israelensis ATCC 35646]MEC3432269.1 site-specific integrase [Bacillus cereus]MED1154915.1 site-specific integrase [Bacillus paranthracis]AFQ29618.1 integrase [Bacillus thuringiensis HD-789]AJH06421.1 int protein [Bacillus thuringiensis HD1002]
MASFQKYETKQGYKWLLIAEIGIDPTTGKRKQKKVRGFKTKKEAQLAAARIEQEVANGTYINEPDILFKDFVQEWLNIYSKSTKISSLRVRQKQSNKLVDFFANIKMKDITKKMYQTALNDLHDKGYAFNTLDGIHTAGRMIFKKAIELQIIKSNPTDNVKLPRKVETVEDIENDKKAIKYLEKEELAHFLQVAKEKGLDNDYVFFSILAYSGLRAGELLALKWTDVDFENNTIKITKTLYNPDNNSQHYHLLTPKTKGSIRTIKMDQGIMKLLKSHKAKQNELKLYTRPQYVDQGFVITKASGYPEVMKMIQNRLKRLIKLSNITKNITPHSFRHTHTSLLIEAGVGIKEIQQRLGHTDIETTMNIYAHMTKNMEEKASQKFSELMKGFVI